MQQSGGSQPPAMAAPNLNLGQAPTAGINPSAAPGPIPATTPLVVKQDSDGVQWIAFEYSRDRVKSQYTIRCDVEAVNVDSLSADFKNENCVYPRACCAKEHYKGNRLAYETECNAVGWSLAQLNVCLRGKRGLIQRAVDSWRNSNQDARLRSRRVRRQAKVQQRNKSAQQPAQMSTSGGTSMIPTSATSNANPGGGISTSSAMTPLDGGHMHHQPARSDLSVSGPPDPSGMLHRNQ